MPQSVGFRRIYRLQGISVYNKYIKKSQKFKIFSIFVSNLIKIMTDKELNSEFYSKEISILRQSQQKMVFDFATSKGVNLNVMELQRITDIFVQLCLRPMDKDLKQKVNKLDKWLNEKSNTSIKKIHWKSSIIK